MAIVNTSYKKIMEFIHESNRIFVEDIDGKCIAEVTFPVAAVTAADFAGGNSPADKEQVVEINHTFVDDSLRGQGVAGKLMEEAVKQLKEENKKAILTCPYAISWFGKNEQYDEFIWKR